MLVLSIVLSAFPLFSAMSFAEAWDGSSKSEPTQVEGVYQISDASELAWFASKVNESAAKEEGLVKLDAVLCEDIDLGGKAWTPIGNTAYIVYTYGGVFDGQNHSISNLSINASSANYGLFGTANSATIKNIKLSGTVSSNNVVGGLIGKLQTGTVENCSFAGSVTSTGKTTKGYVGGLIGTVGAKDALIKGCCNTADVSGTYAGGIVGFNKNSGSIISCYNTGKITGVTRSGGIAGQQSSGAISYCYSIGESTNGICGFSNAAITNCFYLNDEASAPGGTASGYQKISDSEVLLASLNAGSEKLFVEDKNSSNNSYPLLNWQVSEEIKSVPVKSVVISGKAETGATLNSEAFGDNEESATNVSFQWYVSENGSEFSAIEGASNSYFEIPDTSEYAGKILKLVASGEEDSSAFALTTLIEKSQELIDSENAALVKSVADALNIDTAPIKEETKISLPTQIEGCSISWESDNEAVIESDGTVTLPEKNIVNVNLKATVSLGNAIETKSFSIDVWAKDIEPDVYLQKALESMKWSFKSLQPEFGKDTNILFKFKEVLKAKGFEGIEVTVDSTDDESLVSSNGKIFYPAIPEGGSFADGRQVKVVFKLSLEGESVLYPDNIYALLIPWDTTDIKAELEKKADELINEDTIKGDNESLESIDSDLVLPSNIEGDKFSFAWIEWTSSDENHLAISNENRSSGADSLYNPYIGSVKKDAEPHEIELKATIKNPSSEVSVVKTFNITINPFTQEELESRLEKMNAVLDCYTEAKLKNILTKEPLDANAVDSDIQLVIPKEVVTKSELAKLDYGKYWDYWNYKFTVTSSDEETVEINYFRANVFRPLGEDSSADKEVTLTVKMVSKANENLFVTKDLHIVVKHLERAEIDRALELMDEAKINYVKALLGNNPDSYSIIDNLTPFKKVVWNEAGTGVSFTYSNAENKTGIIVDTIPGWEKQEDYRLFKTSNPALISNETLILNSTPSKDTCVKIESVLSDESFSKYYEKYKSDKEYDKEALLKFASLYKQPVSAYVIVLGAGSYNEKFASLDAEKKAELFEENIEQFKEESEKNITVTFTLLGHGGEVMIAKTEESSFTSGAVVFDVFKKVLEDNGISYTAKGSYVSSIGGLSEFDYGKYSGWMFTVGGAFANAPMNAVTLSGGEDIVVMYVDDFVEANKTDISKNSVLSGVENKVYTGSAITQNITLSIGGKVLTPGTDYIVSYADNIEIGTATLTITGTGKYKGSITKLFEIEPIDISSAEVKGIVDKAYTGDALKQAVSVMLSGKVLKEGADYTLTYKNNTEVGKAEIVIEGIGIYRGTITKSFDINFVIIDESTAVIEGVADKVYSGNELTQAFNLSVNGAELVEGKDFTVSYSANIEVGTATLTVKGLGRYSGSYSVKFNILAKDIHDAQISGIKNKSYTAKAQTQSISVNLDGTLLKEGRDFTLSYENNVKVGKATLIITGIGNYSGSISKTFTINLAKPVLKLSKASAGALTLKWNKVAGAKFYRVYSFDAKTGKYKKLANVSSLSYTVKKLKAGSTYRFLVRAYFINKAGKEVLSPYTVSDNLKAVTLCKAPAVKSSVSKKTVTLKWNKVSGAKFYRVYKFNPKTGKYKALVKGSTALSVKLKNQAKGKGYYLVRAFNSALQGSAYTKANLVKATVK